MKSTVKVSIGRLAFHLDADAHLVLKDYLDRLEKHFAGKESGKEIVSDIEERLSELLVARLTQPTQVVTLSMVQEVMAIMGTPDDMEDEPVAGTTAIPPVVPRPRYKRLYRDMERKVIGGVCSGLGAYLNIDVVFVRLFFILFLFGFSAVHYLWRFSVGEVAVLAYIILWIVVPAARTAAEKLEMRGNHNPTVADIERKMLEDAERSAQSIFVRFIKGFFRACLVIFGIMVLAVALFGFLFIPWTLFMFDFVPHVAPIDLLNYIDISSPVWVVKLLIGAVLALPLLGLVYLGVKALFGFKGKYKIGLIVFILWLVAVIGLAAALVPTINAHRQWANLHEEREVTSLCDTLYVNVPEAYRHNREKMIVDVRGDDEFFAFWTDEAGMNTAFYMLPLVEIRHTNDTGNIRINYTRAVLGRDKYSAKQNLEAVTPKLLLRDSLLLLEPFIFDRENKWSGEMMNIKIYVPRNKTIKLDMLESNRKYVRIKLRGIHVNGEDVDINL